jgi:predicted outer membrane repeat protein
MLDVSPLKCYSFSRGNHCGYRARENHPEGAAVKTAILVICATITVALCGSAQATTVYVDDDAPGDPGPGDPTVSDPLEDGSPEHPFDAIQEGIDNVVLWTYSIQVADGTYRGVGNRDISFGGKVITLESENGPTATLIDCEDAGRGVVFDSGEGPACLLDGFTILNGDPSDSEVGAGISCVGSSPTIRNCVIRDCQHYSNNTTVWGAGVAVTGSSNVMMSDCVISDCVATGDQGQDAYGGGVYCSGSQLTMERCTIESNTARSAYIYSSGAECFGGGVCCESSTVVMDRCVICDNTAADYRSIFNGYGGGVYCSLCDVTMVNCILSGNRSEGRGGAICCEDDTTIEAANCTIVDNVAASYGGAVFCPDSGTPVPDLTLTNCILWGNEREQVHEGASTVTLIHCDIEGGWSGGGSGNINADPLLRSDCHILAGSPCIGAGTSSGAPGDDIDGEARPWPSLGTYDIGADEFVDSDSDGLPDWWEGAYYGDASGDPDSDGLMNLGEYEWETDPDDDDNDNDGRLDGTEITHATNPVHPDNVQRMYYVNGSTGDDAYDGLAPTWDGVHGPKQTIQAGLDATVDGWSYIVEVAEGTYTGDGNRDLDLFGKAITLRSVHGAAATIIDCEGVTYHRGFVFYEREAADSVVDGFTITNGTGPCYGGGILCGWYTAPTIQDCVITDCFAYNGGGVYCCAKTAASFSRCTIQGNSAFYGGGIVYNGDGLMSRCRIVDNYASDKGAGVYCEWEYTPVIQNCFIAGNTTDGYGGGFLSKETSAQLINCTIVGNSADPEGAGIHILDPEASVTATNCIVWDNGVNPVVVDDGSLAITYSDVAGGWPGEGNIDDDPLFGADWHLTGTSPCIDWCPAGPAIDIDGESRPYEIAGVGFDGDRLYDIGADECHDTDGDGMSNEWEDANGLDPNDPTDALLDSDGDGLVNVEEFRWESDPRDPASPAFVYVDDDNAGDPAQDGTAAHPYEAIQLAIDAATAPAVVKALAGRYAEGIVPRHAVWIVGSGPHLTTIDSLNGSEAVYADGVTDCLLTGFTIISGADYNAVLTLNSTLTLRGCVIAASKNGCGVDGGGLLRLNNCVVAGHAVSGLWQNGSTTDVELVNCTVADNGTYGVARWGTLPATITIHNTIVTGNGDDITGDAGGFVVTYSNIGDGDFAGSDGNISADPLFVGGPLHDYYLSQIAAGQAADSPCVDAGSGTTDSLGLPIATTRTDGGNDADAVDMGYHAISALWVDVSNTTGPWDGTSEHPYQTIQDGIDNAPSGAVVLVLPGTYYEGIAMASGVTIIGPGPHATTIDAQNTGEAVYADQVVNGTLEGFAIISGVDYNAVKSVGSTLTVHRCVVTASKNGCGADGGGLLRLENCLVAGHVVSGLWQNGSTTDMELANCTVCDNGSYGVARWCSGPAMITIRDTIVCGNGDDIVGDPAGYAVSYSDIGDGDFAGVDGNVSADPVFVSGALHDYYLSQIAAGQAINSPCVDTGSDAAEAVGTGWLSTRTDHVCDTGTVDMGYHTWYGLEITSVERSGNDITIHWNALPGLSYVVEWSADLETWNEVAVGEAASWTDVGAVPANEKRFYRVREDEAAAASMPSSDDVVTGRPAITPQSDGSDKAGSSGVQRRGNVRRGSGNVSER